MGWSTIAAPMTPTTDNPEGGSRATVVLVHGAWHGAWCWERVVDGLVRAGVETVAVDLPGHGADPGPFSDLHGDAARVRSVLDETHGPVVLVGHSYGGAVITEAGDHPAVRHLVYVAALALDAEETCMAAAVGQAAPPVATADRPDLSAGLEVHDDGTATIERSLAAACLYNDCDQQSTEWALDRLGPQPLITLQQEPRAVAWRTIPSTYVVCQHDQTVSPELQRVLATRCTTSVEWPTDHSPFLSDPQLVVDLLRSTAVAAG